MTMYSVTIGLLEGRNFPAADANGLSDPVCEVSIRGRDPSATKKSQVVKKTLNPKWHEGFQYGGVAELDVLVIKVFDWERVGKNELLGICNVSFEQMVRSYYSESKSEWFPLSAPALHGDVLLSFDISPVPPAPLARETVATSMTASLDSADPAVAYVKAAAPLQVIDLQRYHIPFQPLPYIPNQVSLHVTFQSQTPTDKEPAIGVCGSALRLVCHLIVNGPLAVRFRNLLLSFSGKVKGSTTFLSTKEYLMDDMRDVIKGPASFGMGHHVIPFQVWLPESLPSSVSFEDVVKVKYSMKLSADIVNMPDVELRIPVRIINPADTVGHSAPQVVELSKSPMGAGGTVSAKITVPRSSFAPGEEFEVHVEMSNQTSRKIKRLNFHLRRLTSLTSFSGDRDVVLSSTKKFYPRVPSNNTTRQTFVVEIPKSLESPHSLSRGKLKLSYVMRIVIDIPLAHDAYVDIPVTLLIPDAKKLIAPAQATATATGPATAASHALDTSPLKWDHRQVSAWIAERAGCPVIAAVLSESMLNGRDFLSVKSDLWPEVVPLAATSCKAVVLNGEQLSAPEVDKFAASHRALVHRHLFPRLFLLSLGMGQYVEAMEKEEIGHDELVSLASRGPDHLFSVLRAFNLTMGAALRLCHAVTEYVATLPSNN
eukprot:ANDGO_08455.mRNA.1 Arrestin domain-containing protein C